jgi:hypothetical protein
MAPQHQNNRPHQSGQQRSQQTNQQRPQTTQPAPSQTAPLVSGGDVPPTPQTRSMSFEAEVDIEDDEEDEMVEDETSLPFKELLLNCLTDVSLGHSNGQQAHSRIVAWSANNREFTREEAVAVSHHLRGALDTVSQQLPNIFRS